MDFNIFLVITIIWNIKFSYQVDFVIVGENKFLRSIAKRAVTTDPPEIKEFIVKTIVANRFAETRVLSKVENVKEFPQHTSFSVVFPERALISGFFMEIDGKTYKACVMEKHEAKKLFSQSLSLGRSAAHVAVSMRNSNRFTININVGPESEVSFYLTYEELLQREKGLYGIIANIQPGQLVPKLEVEVEIKENAPLLFVRPNLLRPGNMIQDNVKLDPQAIVTISNTSAVVKFYPDMTRQVELECAGLGNKKYGGFAGQFVVQYDIERDPQGGETLFQDDIFINYFALPSLDPIPKHVVFVLDTSTSMHGMKLRQLKEAMASILPQLHPEDLFDIVQFESSVYLRNTNGHLRNVFPNPPLYGSLSSHLKRQRLANASPATEKGIKETIRLINNMRALGATNTLGALEVGLYLVKRVQERHKGDYQPILVFLTDGVPYYGITDRTKIIRFIETINDREYNTPIYSVSIGNDADWDFLRRLSLTTGGVATRIHVDKVKNPDVSHQLMNFYEKIATPILTNVTFNNLPVYTQLTKSHYQIFFNGSEIIIAGKGASKDASKPITVSAKSKKGYLNLEAKTGIPLTRLERIWAYLKVKQLLDDYYATSSTSNRNKLSKQVLQLAYDYSFVTDLTSLVVVGPDDMISPADVQDAMVGIFPESMDELPMCKNITDWIMKNVDSSEDDFIGESEVGRVRPERSIYEAWNTRRKTCKDTLFGCRDVRATPVTHFKLSECAFLSKSGFGKVH